MHFRSISALLGLVSLSCVTAFAPAPMATTRGASKSALSVLPTPLETSDMLLSVSSEDYRELAKSTIIVLLFGGGLIPAAIAANKSMVGTLTGKAKSDPNYIAESDASGPALPGQALLFANESIPLVDVIAIMGRIRGTDSIANWTKLPSTEQAPNVMWLPRAMFKENIRNSKFTSWPVDKNGEPIGGKELEKMEKGRISKKGAVIGDAALEAVFDSWAWGASIATPDKVEKTLQIYKKGDFFDVSEFVSAATRGRAVTGLGALTFVVIQVVAYSSLFIAPLLRTFFNLDIGFGQLGDCEGICTSIF